jgi:hypothetical protein
MYLGHFTKIQNFQQHAKLLALNYQKSNKTGVLNL